MVDRKRITIFHPNFSSSHPLGGAIIECGSGVSFRFPLDLLSISTLFADAADISSSLSDTNTSADGSENEVPIVLPTVSHQGFHILLTALHPIKPYDTLSNKIATLASKSAEDILEAYHVADVLDIPYPTLSRLLIPFFPDPFVKFALSTATSPGYGSEEDQDLIQTTVVGTFNREFDRMSRLAEILLIELNPQNHIRLRNLLRSRKELPTSLYSAFRYDPTPDGIDNFYKKCKKLPCPAFASVRNKGWTQMRILAACFVWEALAARGCSPRQRVDVANSVLEQACKGCPKCFERLSACSEKAINDMEAQLPVRV